MRLVSKDDPFLDSSNASMARDDALLAPEALLSHLKTRSIDHYPWSDSALYTFIYLHQQSYPSIVDWIKEFGPAEWSKIFTYCSLRIKSAREALQVTNLTIILAIEAVRIDHLLKKDLIIGHDVGFITSPTNIPNSEMLSAIIVSSYDTVIEFYSHSDTMVSTAKLTSPIGVR